MWENITSPRKGSWNGAMRCHRTWQNTSNSIEEIKCCARLVYHTTCDEGYKGDKRQLPWLRGCILPIWERHNFSLGSVKSWAINSRLDCTFLPAACRNWIHNCLFFLSDKQNTEWMLIGALSCELEGTATSTALYVRAPSLYTPKAVVTSFFADQRSSMYGTLHISGYTPR